MYITILDVKPLGKSETESWFAKMFFLMEVR